MKLDLEDRLKELLRSSVAKAESEEGVGNGPGLSIFFSTGDCIRSSYWRILGDSFRISSFDHDMRYGNDSKINAVAEAEKVLLKQVIASVSFDKASGDICLRFENNIRMEIFNFTSHEAWEIEFKDGTGQYSNYV